MRQETVRVRQIPKLNAILGQFSKHLLGQMDLDVKENEYQEVVNDHDLFEFLRILLILELNQIFIGLLKLSHQIVNYQSSVLQVL